MFLAELSTYSLVRYVGLVVVLRTAYQFFWSIFDFIRSRLFPVNFKEYGEWTVVTGATDGIGRGLAREFAKHGMNIVLISRNEEKLKHTAKELEDDFSVKTICVQADFTSRNVYGNIEKALKDLDVGVLVNNVGTATVKPKEYTRFDVNEIWGEMDVNMTSAVTLTWLLLPKMKAKRKGLIVNVSSLSSEIGLPATGIYAPTKAFLTMFSQNLLEETNQFNVKVKCLIPGMVKTKIIASVEDVAKELSFIVPNCDTFVEYAFKSLSSSSNVMTGHWRHSALRYLTSFFPLEFNMRILKFIFIDTIEDIYSKNSSTNKKK